jgi:oligopeptide/dipeptide ABC transporter ATP-binding protein
VLDVRQLGVSFFTGDDVLPAVQEVSFTIGRGRTLGLVGESGCGKTVTALSVLGLIPSPPGRVMGGEVWFDGRDLLSLPEPELNRVRGQAITMIFQEPMTSLNPVFTVGDQVAEAVIVHDRVSRRAARVRAVEVLGQVGLPAPAQQYGAYPHELSGGMRQRVMIAMALACRPALLIADEPTTALDVTIQAQILDLLRALQADTGMSLLLITHDLGVIAEMADDVAVMYAGRIVEHAPIRALFDAPRHPYTQGLLASIPTLDTNRQSRLEVIDGSVPHPSRLPAGCAFTARCPQALPHCAAHPLSDVVTAPEHRVRCWLHAPPPPGAIGRELTPARKTA